MIHLPAFSDYWLRSPDAVVVMLGSWGVYITSSVLLPEKLKIFSYIAKD